MKRSSTIFLLLLLAAVAVRLVWFFNTDNAGNGDAAARLNITQVWLYSNWQVPSIDYLKILNPSLDWLPLHFYLVGFVSYIFHDLVYAPRLFTLLISALTLIPLYKVCLLRYDRTTANIAAAILAFYGMHIFLSGLILSESFYIFFLMWCYYFIERYRLDEHDTQWIVLLALSLFACCLLRYEGWILAPLVIITMPFIKKMRVKNLFLLGLIPSVAICFVMFCEVKQGQHPLRGLLYSDFEVKQTHHFTGASHYANFLPAYLPGYFIAIIFILLTALKTKNRANTLVLALYLLPICPLIIKVLNGTLTTQARYLVIYMVPGIVFIAGFINSIAQKFRLRNIVAMLIVALYILVSNISFAAQVHHNTLKLKYAHGLANSAHYFRDSVSEGKAYIDYGADLSSANWMVYANLYEAINSAAFIDSVARINNIDPKLFLERERKGARYRITGHEYEWKTWSKSSFDGLLQNNQINYIVLFPGGPLSKSLSFCNECEVYLNRKFTRVFSEDGYVIYKIEKACS